MRLFVNGLQSGSGGEIPLNVLIIAGQSNARGNTNFVSPPDNIPNPNAYIIGEDKSATGGGIVVSAFEVMNYPTDNFLGYEFGVEANYAKAYGTSETYIVKMVRGGTNLAVDWASGSVMRNALLQYINTAKTFFETNNIKVQWSFYWDQWESDAPNNTYSDNYETNYQGLISEMLVSTGIELEKHIIAKVNPNSSFYTNNVANGNKIITAQQNNATLYGATIMDFDSLALWDGVHYSAASNETRGTQVFSVVNG